MKRPQDDELGARRRLPALAPRWNRGRVVLVAVALLVTLAPLIAEALAAEGEALQWSDPQLVAPASLAPDAATGYSLNAISCPSTGLCVATAGGDSLISSHPADGGASWAHVPVAANTNLTSVSCPSEQLCVAAGASDGTIATTTTPLAASPQWQTTSVGVPGTQSVVCPDASFCIAPTSEGDVLWSQNPAAGEWHRNTIDAANAPLTGIACASKALCVAIDYYGNAIASSQPASGSWSVSAISTRTLEAVACPSARLCLAVDQAGNVFASSDPSAPSARWSVAGTTGRTYTESLACPAEFRCVAVDSAAAAMSDDPTDALTPWTEVDYPSALRAVSCPQVTFCVLVDQRGFARTGSGSFPTGLVSVTLAGEGSGRVTAEGLECPASCSARYARGSSVRLAATPDDGSSFAGWGGECAGAAECVVSVDAASLVSASFARIPKPPGFVLTLAVAGPGAVKVPEASCPPSCRLSYPPGSSVRLNPAPAKGARFVGWGGACVGNGSCTLSISRDLAVFAQFASVARKPRVRIRRVVVHRRARSASLAFAVSPRSVRATCALVRLARKPAKPRFHACRSPKTFRGLRTGRYLIAVRAGVSSATQARRVFTLR